MKPAIIEKMEKSEGTKNQIQIVQGICGICTSRYRLYAICGLVLSLVAGILVLTIVIYADKKDIRILRAHDHQFSTLNPKLDRSQQLMDRLTKNVTFHIARTGETMKENIVITDKEEIITTSRATFIFDYSNGWLVTKLSDRGTNVCHISEFKMENSIDYERESLQNIKGDVPVKYDDAINTQYNSTDRVVDVSMLSPTAASMCQESHLVWFTAVSNRRGKRGSEVDFNAQEEWDGDYTDGSYSVALPDGRIQTVTYTVN